MNIEIQNTNNLAKELSEKTGIRVELIGLSCPAVIDTENNDESSFSLPQQPCNIEAIIDTAARTCYKSKPKPTSGENGFIRGLIKAGHESTIEHSSVTFKISGVSRALTHQLVRHRLFSFSQESQRYCSFNKIKQDSESISATASWYMVPEAIKNNCEALKIYTDTMQTIENAILKISEIAPGIKNEDSRALLPNATLTTIVVTGNLREWRHFLKLRLDTHAQEEIRNLAKIICCKLNEYAPNVFFDLINQVIDNT